MVTDYQGWRADGSPWRAAAVVVAWKSLFERHGYTVYVIGDLDHLTANTPEDHTPYSHTPWPGPQPYPQVLALDVMPGGDMDWHELGQRLVDAKNAKLPGTECLKYINYTDKWGRCRHASWEPLYADRPSTDRGHIHISVRTDYVNDTRVWDPWSGSPGTGGIDVQMPELAKGAKGWPVATLQGALGAHGSNPQGIDGDFGPHTDSAVRDFQTRNELAVDGVVGLHTWSVLITGHDL